MDESIEQGRQWLTELLQLMGVVATVKAIAVDAEENWLEIETEGLEPQEVALLAGEGGQTLDAIQYLANSVLNLKREADDRFGLTIELEGIRQRARAELFARAKAVAERVRESGQAEEMTSLSSAERRQVHNYLKAYPDLESFSQGAEPDRRLAVRRRQEQSN